MNEFLTYVRQPGLTRLWQGAREKYQRYGRVAGKVELCDLTDNEIDALQGLLVENLYGQTRVAIKLTKVDEALQAGKFGVGLQQVLSQLFPDMRTHEEDKAIVSASWTKFCDWTKQGVANPTILAWIEELGRGKVPGYRTYLECYKQFAETGDCGAWSHAIVALDRALTPHSVWRLPVFSAVVTGDPHGLDRNTLAGKMFYWGLVALTVDGEIADETEKPRLSDDSTLDNESQDIFEWTDEAEGAPSEHVRLVYMKVGIRLDDASSVVLVGNWPGVADSAIALPLMTVETLADIPAPNLVYVVENPSVFAELVERFPKRTPVVCTSGQPSVAALKLLDLAVAAGATLRYNGDFDVKGLQMAMSLRKRYGDAWQAWHMDSTTYMAAIQESYPSLTQREIQLLQNLNTDWDNDLIPAMATIRKKVFQEHILSELLRDFGDLEGIHT